MTPEQSRAWLIWLAIMGLAWLGLLVIKLNGGL